MVGEKAHQHLIYAVTVTSVSQYSGYHLNHATDMVHIFICLELPHSSIFYNTYML